MDASTPIAGPSSAGPESAVRPVVGPGLLALALVASLAFVHLTRWPVMRAGPMEIDEVGFLERMAAYRFPMAHTLFLAAGRVVGDWVGDPYRGLVALDQWTSAVALVSVWWWLRALVRPATAAAATLLLAVGPTFWAYGAMAGNYTAIPLVGAFLLGIAARGPRAWHPFAASALLAVGTGYRIDIIGLFWTPILLVILRRHRWPVAAAALGLLAALDLAWFLAMLHDAGGWAAYRAASGRFAESAGYRNSVWNLGLIDAPLRYAVKLGMALFWTFGPALVLAPRGVARLVGNGPGRRVAAVLLAAAVPALAFHLLIHFGVAGYAFHYVPGLIALIALGAGRRTEPDRAPFRLLVLSAVSAAVFWFYPTDYDRPGLRGDFDLSFARCTRIGLRAPLPRRIPSTWRTSNSVTIDAPTP